MVTDLVQCDLANRQTVLFSASTDGNVLLLCKDNGVGLRVD